MANNNSPVLYGQLVRFSNNVKANFIHKPVKADGSIDTGKEGQFLGLDSNLNVIWTDVKQGLLLLVTSLPTVNADIDKEKIYVVEGLEDDGITKKYDKYINIDGTTNGWVALSSGTTLTPFDIEKYLYALDGTDPTKVDKDAPLFIPTPSVAGLEKQILTLDANLKPIWDDSLIVRIDDLDSKIGKPTHYEKDDTNTGLIVVSDGTLTDNTTEIEEKDVLGIATVGEYVKLVNATGINKILEDTDDRLDKIETVKNADFKQAIIDEILDGVQPKYVTQAEYDSLSDADKNNPKIEYHITDAPIVEYQLKTDDDLTTTDKTTTGAINELDAEIGDKREFTPKHYELDSATGVYEVVADNAEPFDELTQVKLTDANKNNEGTLFVVGDKVNLVDEVTTKPASGVFKYIDNAIAQAQLGGEEVDLSGYQEKQDDALKTNDKTVTGAINQLVDILTVAPTYVEPTLALTANPSTLKQEVGTKITPILSYTFTQNDAGAETSHTFSPVDSETQAQLTIVEGDNIEYSVTVNYGAGAQKADNFGNLSGEAIQAGSLTKTLKYVGYRKNFYVADAGTAAPTDSAEVRALTSFSTGTQRINVAPNSQRIVIACPGTKTLTSAKYVEQGNAEYKDNFTLTTVQVSGATDGKDLIDYNVYTYVFAIPNSAAMTFNISIA